MTPRAATPLERCPWCPGGDEEMITQHYAWIGNEAAQFAYHVECHECRARGPEKPTEGEAATAWNTRAPSSPLVGELIAALGVAKGYMLNAKIDLETGAKKATALATLEGGLRLIESALARAKDER